MDRDVLQQHLDEGLSLADIGKRLGRHEATVSYWLKKHGLVAAHREKHTARGGLDRRRLEELVEAGMSIAQIAEAVDRSKPTVRHWLRRYGLRTRNGRGAKRSPESARAREQGLVEVTMRCARHAETRFVIDIRGYYRCCACRSEAVSRRRRRVKQLLVAEAGGACQACGYAGNARALHFHHVDPTTKRFEINARGAAMAIAVLREEARKCVLLCANCHAEAEEGKLSLPSAVVPP
jgi:transposase